MTISWRSPNAWSRTLATAPPTQATALYVPIKPENAGVAKLAGQALTTTTRKVAEQTSIGKSDALVAILAQVRERLA